MIDTVTVMSCYRSPSFLKETLESIPSNFNIEVLYQGTEVPDQYTEHNITLVDHIQDISLVFPNSQYNYASCLLKTKDGFIVEDDVLFSSNFNEYFAIVQDLMKPLNYRYALAIYSCYNWQKDSIGLMDYPVDNFYGTQAMLYDLETARSFGEYLMGRIGVEPYDLALKSYIKEVDPSVKLLAVTRSLVQHIGHTTSGLGFFHQTGNFIDNP